jgi:general secretion pathway protein G
MARRRTGEQTIFFPWERGGSVWGRRGITRARPFVAGAAMILLLLVLGARERRLVGIRSTRATLSVVHAAVDAYRADHQRACPASLEVLTKEGYMTIAATDAWGRPLRLTCPGRQDPLGYELTSDGPDGEIGGLDRVE